MILIKYLFKETTLSDKKIFSNDLFKYFIGYRHKGNAFPSPLCIKFAQMNVYFKHFDKNNKCMNLLVNDEKLLKNILIYGIKLLIKNEFNSKRVHNDKYIKT